MDDDDDQRISVRVVVTGVTLAALLTLGIDPLANQQHAGSIRQIVDPEHSESAYRLALPLIENRIAALSLAQIELARTHASKLTEATVEFESRREAAFRAFERRQHEGFERFGFSYQDLDTNARDVESRAGLHAPGRSPGPTRSPKPPESSASLPADSVEDRSGWAPSRVCEVPARFTDDEKRALVAEGVRRFGAAIESAARKYRLEPRFLLCVMKIESAYGVDAVSRAGALGLMQLMPSTAAELGVNPYDLADNVHGGARMIDQLLSTYAGDSQLAMAAYNAGPGAVDRYGGVPPFPETRRYIERVESECGRPRQDPESFTK